MKKKLLPALFMLSAVLATAQSPDFAWAKTMGGTARETPVAIDLDAAGNIYHSGYFEGTTDFDPGTATYTLSSPGCVSGYISKLDAQGNFLWAKQLTAPYNLTGFNVHIWGQAVCSNGDICVTGNFNGVIDFNPGTATLVLASSSVDMFVLKLDALGNFLWAKQMSGPEDDYAKAIAVDAADAVYTTGFFMGTVDFDPGAPTYTMATAGNGNAHAFVSKLNAAGDFVWAKQLVTTSVSIGNAVTIAANGDVYTTGSYMDNADFDPDAGVSNMPTAGDQDAYIWKLTGQGNFAWAKHMGGVTKEGGIDVITDASGNAYMSGFFTGTGDFDPGTGTHSLTAAGGNDMFISKLDVQGNLVWVKAIGGAGNDVASKLCLGANGDIYTTGQFENTVDFDPNAGTYALTTNTINTFIAKLDNAGNLKWAKHLECTGIGGGCDITTDAGNNVYTTGIFNSVSDFDPNVGTYTLTAAGQEDIFIQKMLCGNPPDVSAATSTSLVCEGNSVALTASGASTYTWNAGAGNPLTVSPALTTTYTVTGSDAGGCMAIASITQFVSACTGIQQTGAAGAGISVYPNPNKGLMILNVDAQHEGSMTIHITNALGQLVRTAQSSAVQTQVSIEELPAGLYFVSVFQNNALQSQVKVVKE